MARSSRKAIGVLGGAEPLMSRSEVEGESGDTVVPSATVVPGTKYRGRPPPLPLSILHQMPGGGAGGVGDGGACQHAGQFLHALGDIEGFHAG